jgi:hypothetical protein
VVGRQATRRRGREVQCPTLLEELGPRADQYAQQVDSVVSQSPVCNDMQRTRAFQYVLSTPTTLCACTAAVHAYQSHGKLFAIGCGVVCLASKIFERSDMSNWCTMLVLTCCLHSASQLAKANKVLLKLYANAVNNQLANVVRCIDVVLIRA